MTGDLLMNSSNNDSVSIGCIDFGTEEKSFLLWLGSLDNGLAYNTFIQSQPVTLGKYIYNLSPPLHEYDATTKGYVDGVVKKCHVGLIPILSRNVDKTGYMVSVSSQQSSSYTAF